MGLAGRIPTCGGRDGRANEGVFFNDGLDQAGIDRIAGLSRSSAVSAVAAGADQAFFEAGNILLGGGGSDTIQGNGGDDILDGDRWLNVRIGIKANADGTAARDRDRRQPEARLRRGRARSRGSAIPAAWVGKSLFELMVDRTVKPAQMQIVREILTDNSTTDVDTAVFNDIQSNYTIRVTDRAGRHFTVTHTTLTDQAVDDGTDTLRNFEKVQFADGTVVRGAAPRPALRQPQHHLHGRRCRALSLPRSRASTPSAP